jgi:hypothetical protein
MGLGSGTGRTSGAGRVCAIRGVTLCAIIAVDRMTILNVPLMRISPFLE